MRIGSNDGESPRVEIFEDAPDLMALSRMHHEASVSPNWSMRTRICIGIILELL